MAMGSRRGWWRGPRARWGLLAATVALAAGVWFWPSRGLQKPAFQPPSASGSSQSPAAKRLRAGAAGANVIIILTDAAAARHFTSFGHQRDTTPNMGRFHEQSVLFTEAYSTAASTKPSVTSLFTGEFPDTHGTLSVVSRFTPDAATLSECLGKAGYTTAAITASPSVAASFGFSRGFDHFHEVFRDAGLEAAGHEPRATGGQVVDGALVLKSAVEWLKAHKDERLFAYLHFREPHAPYVAPDPFMARFASNTGRRGSEPFYDASLAYVDSLVGKLLREMETAGLLDKSVVILMADHGEAFGEHGRSGHGATPYTEMAHIPLAFHLPARSQAAARRRSELFSTADVMPTLLDLLQIPPPPTMQGRSRLALLAGEDETTPAFAVTRALGEDLTGGKRDFGQVSYALRVPRYTLILAKQGKQVELYDRNADPAEQRNIARDRPDLVKQLQAQFAAWADTQRGRPVVLPGGRLYAVGGKESDMDDTTRRQLKSLGYLK